MPLIELSPQPSFKNDGVSLCKSSWADFLNSSGTHERRLCGLAHGHTGIPQTLNLLPCRIIHSPPGCRHVLACQQQLGRRIVTVLAAQHELRQLQVAFRVDVQPRRIL